MIFQNKSKVKLHSIKVIVLYNYKDSKHRKLGGYGFDILSMFSAQ